MCVCVCVLTREKTDRHKDRRTGKPTDKHRQNRHEDKQTELRETWKTKSKKGGKEEGGQRQRLTDTDQKSKKKTPRKINRKQRNVEN